VCTPCSRTVSICPVNEALTRCVEGFQTQDSRCVDCNACQQVSSAGVPCYRLSSV
jgi:Fe-S-cluster-containing hydrogenase component 2